MQPMTERPEIVDLHHRSAVLNEKTITVELLLLKPLIQDGSQVSVLKFKVRQPSIGVLEAVGAIVDGIPELSEEDAKDTSLMFQRLKSDATSQIEVLACLIESKAYPSDEIKSLLRENLRPDEALELMMHLLSFADLKSFSTTTILMKRIGLTKSREIIAPQLSESEEDANRIYGELLMELAADTAGALNMSEM